MRKLFTWKTLRNVIRRSVGSVSLLAGTLGLVLLAVNPVPWVASYLPLKINSTTFGSLLLTEEYLQGLMTAFYTDPIVWGSTAGISGLLILLAGILLVRSPKQA